MSGEQRSKPVSGRPLEGRAVFPGDGYCTLSPLRPALVPRCPSWGPVPTVSWCATVCQGVPRAILLSPHLGLVNAAGPTTRAQRGVQRGPPKALAMSHCRAWSLGSGQWAEASPRIAGPPGFGCRLIAFPAAGSSVCRVTLPPTSSSLTIPSALAAPWRTPSGSRHLLSSPSCRDRAPARDRCPGWRSLRSLRQVLA